MKKKVTCALLALLMVGLPACGQNNTAASSGSAISESAEETAPTETLVVYFSRVDNSEISKEDVDAESSASLNKEGDSYVGDTRVLAEIVADETGGDIFSIQVKAPYPASEADTYTQVMQEQLDGSVPELVKHVSHIEQYKNIVLIYPNWMGTIPSAVSVFLDETNLAHKKLLPICTYDATGLDNTVEDLKTHTKAKVLDPLDIRGRSATTSGTRNAVKTFIYDLGWNNEV